MQSKSFLVTVGVDISKDTLDVCLVANCGKPVVFQINNDAKGLSGLVSRLSELCANSRQVLVVCEHTGAYSDKLIWVAKGAGWYFHIAHPATMAQHGCKVKRLKTDKSDAMKICNYAQLYGCELVEYQYPDASLANLRQHTRLRKQWIEDLVRLENQLKAHQQYVNQAVFVTQMYADQIKLLKQQIQSIENEINKLINESEKAKQQFKSLTSIPGIGPVGAQQLILLTNAFEKVSSWKQIACLIGTAPFVKQSGTSINGKAHINKKAHLGIKSVLFEGITSVCTRKNQLFYPPFLALKEKGLHTNSIKIRFINDLLKIAVSIVHKNQLFNLETFLKNKQSWYEISQLS